ncbi:MAG: diacylglycerol kinase family protein [Coriobacteriia bacterium]|nr:diacylglycerol kinase family protein [Coriobacteriia bacterium]
MKLLIINNLASGLNDGSIYDFIRSFTKDGDQVTVRSTDGTTDLRGFLADARDFDLVVASGGDGTIAAVCYELADTGVPVLPFPAGTANLLALNVSSPLESHALSKLAREGRRLDFDLGEINIDGDKYGFGIMAGAGYDATIMEAAKPHKQVLGPLAYFRAAVDNFAPQASHFTITVDGETHECDGLCVLLVNFSKIQFDLSVTYENQPRDGMLDIVVLKVRNAVELLPAIGAAMLDRGGDFPYRSNIMEVHRGRECTIVADPPLNIQYDGEVTGRMTPFSARILPGAATLVVSEQGYETFTEDETEA